MDYREEKNIIKSMLNARCREGTTVEDIIVDFMEFIGEPWRLAGKSSEEIREYMESIDGVFGVRASDGLLKWHVRSKETAHIQKLIMSQKPQPIHPLRQWNQIVTKKLVSNSDDYADATKCYFKDNYAYKYKRYRMKGVNDSTDNLRATAFYNTQLLGDDFFLSILTSELRLPLKTTQPIRQSGLSKSGLSIRGAINLLKSVDYIKTPTVIINVGSIDILHGRDLVDMRYDYEELINVCAQRKIQPIITTLAPLANISHSKDLRNKLIIFNNYLLDNFFAKYKFIHLWSQFVTPRGRTLYEYYESESRYVTGSNQPHVLWNHAGRQRILDHIKRNL